MWEQYRKTFVGMQVTIAAITGGAYFTMYRSFVPAAVFFVVMQSGALLGAYWGMRLKKRGQLNVL
jgi:hypothetical protein